MRKWFALFLLLAGTAFGWEAQLSIDPQIARVGQQVTLTLTVEGLRNPPQPDKIEVEGLRSGLFNSRSSSIQIVNGKYNQQIKFSCAVMAERAGEFEIPLTYTQKGETKKLQTSFKALPAEDGQTTQLSDMFFAKLTANEKSIYVHEPFELQLDIYTIRGHQITDRINLTNMPESGLEELKWSELPAIQRVQDNRIYTIRRYRCRTQALTAGNFQFKPQVTVQAVVQRSQRRRDPFDDFFGSAQTQPIPLEVAPFTLNVKALPAEGRPAGFSEGVGIFDFSVENIPGEVMQGDPITVRMRVRGEGNLKNIKAPVFTSKGGIKTYESSRTALHDFEALFEQVLMLNDPNLKELPALTFSWFDPHAEKYESVTRGPFAITVKPNGSASAQVVTETPTATARTEILGQDIIYLKPLPQTWHKLNDPFWYTRKLYMWLLPLPALLASVTGLILRSVRKLHADPAELRRRGAAKASYPALKTAEKAARQNDDEVFFTEIWNAISGYFGNKLNLSAGEISEARLSHVLQESGLQPEEMDLFKTLLQACDQYRFGMKPQTDIKQLMEMSASVHSIIKHCERNLK